jgi:hypothetical protein
MLLSPHTSTSSPSANVSFAASGATSGATSAASNVEKNIVVTRQQAQKNKYQLWKYVTRHQGPGAKVGGEGMFFGHVVSAILNLRELTTELRAICWSSLVD